MIRNNDIPSARGFVPVCAVAILLIAVQGCSAFGSGTKGPAPQDPQQHVSPVPAAVPPESGPATVAAIRRNPAAFIERMLILEGIFRGWSGACAGSPALTRSDWIFDDGTGCLTVTGLLPSGVSAAAPRGERIVVQGMVKPGSNGEPYLAAQSVRVLPPAVSK